MQCPECGFENLAELARCQRCGWRLAIQPVRPAAPKPKSSASIIVLERAPANSRSNGSATEPGTTEPQHETVLWRQEVSRRVQAYRLRRRQHIEGQADFPFAHGESETPPVNRLTVISPRTRRRETNRIELPLLQPMLAFEDGEPEPVASLEPPAAPAERLRAGLLDFAIVFSSYAAFFVLFAALGRELPMGKAVLAIYGIILLFFFIAYFFLFTALGGRTPGMRVAGLNLVRFDGGPPTFDDALWRTAGYLVSAGSFFLGFVWIYVDARQLAWHDRISKTFVIAAHHAVEEAV